MAGDMSDVRVRVRVEEKPESEVVCQYRVFLF